MATPLTKNYSELVRITKKVESGEYSIIGDPMKTRQKRSRVWSMFARIKDENGEKIHTVVFCTACRNALNYIHKTTTTLMRHRCFQMLIERDAQQLKDKEHENAVSIVEEEKPKISEIRIVHTPVTTHILTNLITKWMIKECQSYELLQTEGIKAFIQKLAVVGSKFGDDINIANFLPNLSKARKDVSDIYERCFERVKAEIDLIKEYGFGLTSDIWTDNFTKQSYIVLTAHYMLSGVLKVRLLGLRTCESVEINNNQTILNKTKQMLEDFDCKLSGKSTIVSDPFYTVPETLQDVQNLPCLSQLLSNVITKSVEEVPEVSEIITACSNLLDFLIKMEQDTLLDGFLNDSYCNRWLKIQKMLTWIDDRWSDIEEVLLGLNEKAMILTINTIHLRAIIKAFQPLEEAMEAFENDSSPNLHLVIVYLHELKKSCDTSGCELQDFHFIEDLKEKLRFYLQKIVTDEIKTLHKIALFLYPPTNKLLQFNSTEKRLIEDECIRLMKNYKQDNEPILTPKSEPGSSQSLGKKRKYLFSDFVASKTNQDSCDLFSREIQVYKSFDVAYSEDFDVFNWWQLHRDNFPYLYKLSSAVLATPATCTASKRIFSNAIGLLRRKSIQVTKEIELQKIMFLNCNGEQSELN